MRSFIIINIEYDASSADVKDVDDELIKALTDAIRNAVNDIAKRRSIDSVTAVVKVSRAERVIRVLF